MQGKPKPVRAHEREVGKGDKKMKSIMISIQPKWCAKIESGVKTIEVRKTRPKIETPFKCYIYCTFLQKPVYDIWINRGTKNRFLGNGKVIGEFVCDRINALNGYWLNGEDNLKESTCLDDAEIMDYIEYINRTFYLWRISDLKIYDKPKELGEFRKPFPFSKTCLNCELNENRTKKGFNTEYCSECSCFKGCLTRPPRSWCYVEELED